MIWLQKKDEGGWTVWIVDSEISGLLELPGRMREILEKTDFSNRFTARLFPTAYDDDPSAEKEYQQLLRTELVRRKMEAVDAVELSLRQRKSHKTPLGPRILEVELTDEQLSLWLAFLHDMRIVIGTALDITDESWERELDPDDPSFDELLLLNQLSYLEETILEAIREAEGLD